MSQVPGFGHVTSTLFHSPLVGVDKETLATCTLTKLVFREKLEEEMNFGNLMLWSMTGAILVSTVLKKTEKGTRVPHICSLCFSKAGHDNLLVKVSETF